MVNQVVEASLQALSLDQKSMLVLAKELLVMDNAEMLVDSFGRQCAESNLTLSANGKWLLKKLLRNGHNGWR
jgi:hypothetical protein